MQIIPQKSGWLYEISFIRPILLILLVSYHAFCYNCGAWSIPEGVVPNETYKWIALLSRAFRLEGFIFVSGYIFALQVLKKDKFSSLKELAVSKFKRLIIPCFLFGTTYYLMFGSGRSPLAIFTGIGHLWYLPCLFWCFLGGYILYKSNFKETVIFLVLALLVPLSVAPIPLQINRAMYYILFFYGGGYFWKHSQQIKRYATTKVILSMWIVFIILLIGGNLLIEKIDAFSDDKETLLRASAVSVNKILKAILAISGIIAIYLTATRYMLTHRLKQWLVDVGTYGYGVYIFHQFILIYLFYHTSLPSCIGSVWLPWVGFALATISSLLLTWLFRQTNIGKKLL